MTIKKELIENLAQKMESNPQIYAEQLLTLRYRFSDLASNYDWLEAECEMHRDSYEGMDASHSEYYENLKQLKAKYLES
jgi:hypothetical protein